MLLAPIINLQYVLPPACEVCRNGPVCCVCLFDGGAFMVCQQCARSIGTATALRISLAPPSAQLEPLVLA